MALKMALSMPLSDIIGYRKVGKAYFGLLEVLCHHHAALVCGCEPPTFAFILASLDAGLRSLDISISSQCAAAVDNLAGFYFRHMQGGGAGAAATAAQVRGGGPGRHVWCMGRWCCALFCGTPGSGSPNLAYEEQVTGLHRCLLFPCEHLRDWKVAQHGWAREPWA